MGFLGTAASSFADTVLIIQTIGFIVLLSGIIYVKRRDFLKHFRMTRITVFLGVLSFIWMGYSLISYLQILGTVEVLLVSHVIAGSVALFAGVLLAFDRLIKKTKAPMRTVFLLWALALVLGILFYINYYTS